MTTPPCPDQEVALERFADGESDAGESLRLREHLSACAPCRIGLRSLTELSRRIAKSPAPPAPPNLEGRIRAALDRATAGRPPRRWIPGAAAAAILVLVTAAFVLRPLPASARTLPDFVVGSAYVYGSYICSAATFEPSELRDYFKRKLDADVFLPETDSATCEGGCPCALDKQQIPWIGYRYGNAKAVSLFLIDAPSAALPEYAKRQDAHGEYHVFRVWQATVLVRRAGDGLCVWIGRVSEEELVRLILGTPEGRDAFSGAPVSIHAILCRACCGRGEPREGMGVVSMQMFVAGRKKLDVDRFIREWKESGIEARPK